MGSYSSDFNVLIVAMSFIIILTILLIVETLADKVYLVNLATEESVELHNDHDALGTKNTLKSETDEKKPNTEFGDYKFIQKNGKFEWIPAKTTTTTTTPTTTKVSKNMKKRKRRRKKKQKLKKV